MLMSVSPGITEPTPTTPGYHSSPALTTASNVSTWLRVAKGATVAAGVVMVLVLILVIWWKTKRRKRDVCGGQQHQGQQNPLSRADNFTYPNPYPPQVPSSPQLSSGYSSKTSNSTQPTPPGLFMSNHHSGGGSGSNYIGGEALPPPLPGIPLGAAKTTFTNEEFTINLPYRDGQKIPMPIDKKI